MNSKQPHQPFVHYYEQFFDILAQSYNASGDPAVYVFENLLRWKGVPADGVRPPAQEEHLSPHFSILSYPLTQGMIAYHTLGASFKMIPGSDLSFNDPRGVRYEYIMHADPAYEQEVRDLLLMIAEYPFLQEVEYAPGFVLPIGTAVVEGSQMEYLYFSYPYVDDTKIYSGQPWGQIERPTLLIQTLWVFPIFKAEADYVRAQGVDTFEQLCSEKHSRHYDAFDFFRKPYL